MGGRIGDSTLDFRKTYGPCLLLLLFSLFLLYDFHREKKWLLGLSLILALLFFITKHPLENEVTVVDVGQGDSIFFTGHSGADGSD
jgi:competence protein ComEC